MAVLTSLAALSWDHGLAPVLVATALVASTLLLRFIISYTRARLQFPGPPVKNFLIGNLDQTMGNDVHEKVVASDPQTFSLGEADPLSSGYIGTENMARFFKLLVPLYLRPWLDVLTFDKWNGLFSRVIYIGDPRIIAEIATSNWPKSAAQYDGFKPLDGDALFVQTNQDRWRMQSKRLAPAFQPSVIQSQYPCLAKHIGVS